MDSKNRTRANLKKYIKVAGKWRFVPVLKRNGIPAPGIVLVDRCRLPQGINTRSALRPTRACCPHRPPS